MIRSTQSVKALPKRLRISIGGFFGPCYEVTSKKGRLTYTYWPPRESYSQEPESQREEIQPSAKQWQTFRRTLDGSTSGAGRLITPTPAGSAMEPARPLKSLTRIDRSSLPVITAFQGGTGGLFPLPPRGLARQNLREILSCGRPPNRTAVLRYRPARHSLPEFQTTGRSLAAVTTFFRGNIYACEEFNEVYASALN